MTKSIIVGLIIIGSFINKTFSQHLLQQHYGNGRFPEGENVYYDNKGRVFVKFKVLNGHLQDSLIQFYSNGQISRSYYFVNGKIHGSQLEFLKNGNISTNYTYNLDTLIYLSIHYYYKNGNVKHIRIWDKQHEKNKSIIIDNGEFRFKKFHKPYTEFISFYSNGSKKIEGALLKSKKAGKWIYYNVDGTIKEENQTKQ
jgi:antitoxin component YwqK of YwqJK toxin-antitoxin module